MSDAELSSLGLTGRILLHRRCQADKTADRCLAYVHFVEASAGVCANQQHEVLHYNKQ